MSIRGAGLFLLLTAIASPSPVSGQDVCKRILKQDASLDNLVDPPGYKTAKLGTLGGVLRVGTGEQAMILIPGLGFGGAVFNDFMEPLAGQYRMYAVTLPGFGGTPAPPCPSKETSFGDQTWTNSAVSAIEKLMKDEKIKDPIIVGHWLTGTQVALRLALKHPKEIKAVVILAGSARMLAGDAAQAQRISTAAKRVASVDQYMAPKWFKTVTRETWDDNNFLPGDYAVNPLRGLRLWREAFSPQLHVWIRYLCEFNAQDMCPELSKLSVPTLILKPGLEGLQHDPGNNYMENYLHKSWDGCGQDNAKITFRTIPNARVCLWFDQSKEVNKAVLEFLKALP